VTLFVLGFVSLFAQVVLLRELSVSFYGVEVAYVLALAAWMAGTAAGAACLGRARAQPSAFESRPRRAAWLVALGGALAPLDVAWLRASRLLAGGVRGAYLPIEQQVLLLLAALVPLSFAFGVAFQWAVREGAASRGRLARAYALETAGAAVAGAVATLAFRFGAQTLGMAVALAGLSVAWLLSWDRGPLARAAGAGVLAAALTAAWLSGPLDLWLTGWNHPGLAASRDTPYGRVTLARAASQVSVFENDVLTADSESASGEELAHLVALQHPHPQRVLLLGGTAEGIDRELARHHPALLDQVEQDEAMVRAVRSLLPDRRTPSIADPRAWLRGHGRYDVIVVATAEPVSGQSNRFYTREFFDECARQLAPDGVVGFRLSTPANYLAPWAVLRAASVARALAGAFRFVDFLPGTTTIVIASASPLPEPGTLVERLTARDLAARLVTPGYLRYLYADDRRREMHAVLGASAAPENRDVRPIAYLYSAAAWLSKFRPGLIGVGAHVPAPDVDKANVAPGSSPAPGARRSRSSWLVACLLLVAVFAAARLRPAPRRAALAAAAGLAGMILETLVLLLYQARQGVLFDDIGLLMTAFMGGSAVGAAAIGRTRANRWAGPALLVLLAAGSAVLAWSVERGTGSSLVGAAALLAATGAVVAGLFGCAAATIREGQAASMGRLYAADVLGGCLGCVAAGLALVPLAGLGASALVVSALALAALVVA
jgi:spermidine synthase